MAESIADTTAWVLELETALFADCDLNDMRKICNGKIVPPNLRAEFWQVCLGVKGKQDSSKWHDMYDLPEQSLIREDCQKLVDKLGNEEEDKVSIVSDIESVITNFSKVSGQTYKSDNGWLDLLEPLIALRLSKYELYDCFYAIQTSYIPRFCDKNGHHFQLLRLLLLYHEPELCTFLDTKKIKTDDFTVSWFQSLFSSTCDLNMILSMWDIYFQLADPFFVFFLALVILLNAKEAILAMKDDSKQAIIDVLKAAPCASQANDVDDFCSLARFYATTTPLSFSKDYHILVFGNENDDQEPVDLSQALCLPVSVHELLLSNRLEVEKSNNTVRYFVVDCRPAEQYNAGHLSTAFHLDSSLMLTEPKAFKTAVDALLAAQQQAILAGSVAAGEHICFIGSGREEEDQYVHMVVASFLQKNLSNVSLAKGGYAALHELLSEDTLGGLSSHNPKLCIICNPSSASCSASEDDDVSFIDKFASAVRSKSAVVKEILVDYITNPQQLPEERHVSSSDRVGKRYRGMAPVFSIDDDQEDGVLFASDDETLEEVNVQKWLKNSEVVAKFKCQEIKESGSLHPSLLVLTPTHLYVLRELPQKRSHALIVARRSLSSIIKITSKRRHPEVITFKYGHIHERGEFEVTALDSLLIPEAGEATKLVKMQIEQLRDASENR